MPDEKVPRKYIKAVAELVIGILIVIIAVAALHYTSVAYKGVTLPEGWAIIQPPGEVSTLVIVNDTVWTGGKDGLILIDRINKTRIPVQGNPPPFGFVRSVMRDRDGRIWVGHDGGLARFDADGWHVLSGSENGSYPFAEALSLLETQSGTIWAGSRGGIAWYGGGTWHEVSPDGGLRLASTDVLFEDRNQTIWIGSADPNRGGLYTLSNGIWTYYSGENGLPHQSVRMVAQSRDGTTWIATGFSDQGGLLIIQNGNRTILSKKEGLSADNARSVYEDSQGRLWVGSEYDGVAISNGTSWRIITTANGLAGNELKVVQEDDSGGYWLGTSGGLNWVRSGDLVLSCGCKSS
jgi:ligand-binding sensor domain-containing protein